MMEPEARTKASLPPPMGEINLTTTRQAEDLRLLALVAQGDREAFAQLYDRFSRPLYATALRIVSDSREAEDVVHDVFITVWDKAAEFQESKGSPFSWAVALTRNRSIDRIRQRRRRQELLAESAPMDLGYDESNGGGHDSAHDLSFREKATAVRQAVASLPEEQQKALELAFFGGLTQQEIAARLQQPLGTVKARIRRGLLKLRDALATKL